VLFERHLTRSMAEDLEVDLSQLLAGIDVDPQGKVVVTPQPTDPRFANPLSGLYWQITDNNGQLLQSRSLWDSALALPTDEPAQGEVRQYEIPGPAKAKVLVVERRILLTINGQRVPIRVAVAANYERVSRATADFAKDLAPALAILGLVLAAATAIQINLGLRPLDALRRGIADIRAGRVRLLPTSVPTEVKPLAEEVNALLDSQEREIERSRGRAADLAHGLKTPLAALAGDALRLREQGQEAIARDIESVVDSMSRHVDRELARARVRGSTRYRANLSTALAPLLRSLIATLTRTSSGSRVIFDSLVADDLTVPMDRTDLAEVLGNILDNAARHAISRVRITARSGSAGLAITIEDDGLGIEPSARERVLERGTRLDDGKEGAGLGLAIVQDVLEAYGWQLDLSTSSLLGGLMLTISTGPQRSRAECRAGLPDTKNLPDRAT